MSKWFWLVIIAVCLGILVFSIFHRWAYDDPYITYRYADNLRDGLGFVYNSGERVQSTTTPLFALLLALLGSIWQDLPKLANLLGAIALALGGVFLWDLAQSWKTPIVGWAGLLLFPTFPLVVTTLGSETPLYLAFCIGAFAFYARERYTLVAVFAALAVLARPDGALVPLILGIDYVLRVRQAIPWRAVFVFLVIAITWFAFAWLYFGSPIPVTLEAKQNQGAMAISQTFAPGLITTAKIYLASWYYWLEVLLATIGLVFVGWKARRWSLFLAWPVLYFFSYTLLGVTRYFWYYAPLVPGFVVLVGSGLAAISGGWQRENGIEKGVEGKISTDNRSSANLPFRQFAAVFLVVFFFIFQVGDLWRISKSPDTPYVIYLAVGEWLQANTSPEDQVGTLEVGIIGYYAQRPMVDFAGLVQPEVAEKLSEDTTFDNAAIWAVNHYQPRYLVLQSGMFPQLEDGFVSQYCQIVRQFSGELYDYSRNLEIYECIGK